MAAGRHIGFRQNAVIREGLTNSHEILRTQPENDCSSEGHFIICIIGNPRWRPTAILDFEKMLEFGNGSTDSHEI
jgi:hypothetical protein